MKRMRKSKTPWLFLIGVIFEISAISLVLSDHKDLAGICMLSGYIFIGWGWIDNYNLFRRG